MSEMVISQLGEFAQWRKRYIHVFIGGTDSCWEEDFSSREAWAWYQGLLAVQVSKLSLFGDMVWDFNNDVPNAARNSKGTQLRLDFSRFVNLSPVVLLEIKFAFLCALKIPSLLKYGYKGLRSVKPNSVIQAFKSGLLFIDALCGRLRELVGADFFEQSQLGIKSFDAKLYAEVAAVHQYTFGPALVSFFNTLRSPYLADCIFDGQLPCVALESLPWLTVTKAGESDRINRILPNHIFEKVSREASFAIVDFLSAMGEGVEDKESLLRKNAIDYNLSKSYGLNSESFDIYVAVRLGAQGYEADEVASYLSQVKAGFWSDLSPGKFKSRRVLQRMARAPLDDDFKGYINFISFAACYIVAQYTGMRPSELSEILVSSCVERDGSYYVIVSNLIKHRQSLAKLFDDKWVAIPIVRDAVRVAQLISRIKQNPYLFSGVNTLSKSEVPKSSNCSGILYQLQNLFKEVLTADEYESLNFSPYTLRHTLAFQMYRAEVGLPFISHQLKHFGELVGAVGQNKSFSETTLGYGNIGDILVSGVVRKGQPQPLRVMAEREYVQNYCDPDGSYAGPNAETHRNKLRTVFSGYMAAGYTKDQIFDQMAKQRLAVINVGQGFCYGGQREDFDASLPCIGSLRCNPNRCKNAIVTKANAPRWREVYVQNLAALHSPVSAELQEELRAAMEEAKGVLAYLGECVD